MMVPDHFVRSNTVLTASSLVPEIRLHLATEILPLWNKTEDEIEKNGLAPPYWAFAWAGGQALARYVIDHPETVRGRSVLDFGSGSGLVAIAAAKAGASSVLAADIDPFAAAAITLNARANDVEIDVRQKEGANRNPKHARNDKEQHALPFDTAPDEVQVLRLRYRGADDRQR